MDITAPGLLQAFFTSVQTNMTLAYGVTEVVNPKIASAIPMGTEQYAEGWTGMGRIMREWNGPRVTETPAPQTYFVTVQNFELTEAIDLFKLNDDMHGIYSYRATQLGMNIKKNPDYQLRDLIENAGVQVGARQTGIDGVSHWSASHPVDFYDTAKGTFPNDYGAAGTSVGGITVGGTLALNSYITVWQDMANRKSESGQRIGVTPDTTMVPNQLKGTATVILQSQFIGNVQFGNLGAGSGANASLIGTTDNTMARGTTDLLVWPDLSGQVAWYMLCTNRSRKPFTVLMRQAAQFLYRNAPTDPVVFDTHSVLYGAHERMTVAWSFPWLSSRSGV